MLFLIPIRRSWTWRVCAMHISIPTSAPAPSRTLRWPWPADQRSTIAGLSSARSPARDLVDGALCLCLVTLSRRSCRQGLRAVPTSPCSRARFARPGPLRCAVTSFGRRQCRLQTLTDQVMDIVQSDAFTHEGKTIGTVVRRPPLPTGTPPRWSPASRRRRPHSRRATGHPRCRRRCVRARRCIRPHSRLHGSCAVRE